MHKFWGAVPVVAGILWMALMSTDIEPAAGRGAPPLSPPDGRQTIASRLEQFGAVSRARWRPFFAAKNLSYPPQKTLLVGLKAEKQLQIYSFDAENQPVLVRTMPVLAASGHIGPKLELGDLQVPEGFYQIESLNPNSRFHLSLRVSYPGEQDRQQAHRDGRTKLGGDIMIHGSNVSAGCLAMGDDGAQDLFVLVADTVSAPVEVLLCPLDFRLSEAPADENRPAWVAARYEKLSAALKKLPE